MFSFLPSATLIRPGSDGFALEPLLPKKMHSRSQDKLDKDDLEKEKKDKKKEKRNSKHQVISSVSLPFFPLELLDLHCSKRSIYIFFSLSFAVKRLFSGRKNGNLHNDLQLEKLTVVCQLELLEINVPFYFLSSSRV